MRNFNPIAFLVSALFLALPGPIAAQTHPACGQVTLYAPHMAVGWQSNDIQWVTIVKMFNQTADWRQINWTYVSPLGTGMAVHDTFANGAEMDGTSGSGTLSPKAAASITLSYCRGQDGRVCSSNLQTGWIVFTTSSTWSDRIQDCVPDIEVSITFQTVDVNGTVFGMGSVGLPFVPADTRHTMDAFYGGPHGSTYPTIGLAVANTNHAATTVTLNVFGDSNGNVPIATTTISLCAGCQTSGMLPDFFRDNPRWQAFLASFPDGFLQGHLEIISTNPVAVLGIRADASRDGWVQMSGIPVFNGQDQ